MSKLDGLFSGRPLFLAPMAGVNDPVFRRICKSQGAALTYTEMVSAAGFAHGSARTRSMVELDKAEIPAAVQIFGHDPALMADMASWLSAEFPDELMLIDINMGCPVRKIAGKGDGAALMRTLPLAEAIIRRVAEASRLPVTVKFRSGWSAEEQNACEFARMAEFAGAAALAIHGRSAAQMYQGQADRRVVAAVKEVVSVPVIASGDVYSLTDIDDYFDNYGADAVMIARGTQGRPWIFSRRESGVSLDERREFARLHLEGFARLRPRQLSAMRKHLAWYLKGFPDAASIRDKINTCKTLADYQELLESVATELEYQ